MITIKETIANELEYLIGDEGVTLIYMELVR